MQDTPRDDSGGCCSIDGNGSKQPPSEMNRRFATASRRPSRPRAKSDGSGRCARYLPNTRRTPIAKAASAIMLPASEPTIASRERGMLGLGRRTGSHKAVGLLGSLARPFAVKENFRFVGDDIFLELLLGPFADRSDLRERRKRLGSRRS